MFDLFMSKRRNGKGRTLEQTRWAVDLNQGFMGFLLKHTTLPLYLAQTSYLSHYLSISLHPWRLLNFCYP
ncbi:hypothetical protein RchiOBHm_Chr5g0011211 [Rosa chinensis]|uniref:Uncharacterized protein n=1 Tax=Rosa chinensis TaxID=74649 RepID=A0A2P6Q4T3_ROSCH|nr:hypothetical protein RchiOBHm_Chr5g0011211 [Rosa chinensis]